MLVSVSSGLLVISCEVFRRRVRLILIVVVENSQTSTSSKTSPTQPPVSMSPNRAVIRVLDL